MAAQLRAVDPDGEALAGLQPHLDARKGASEVTAPETPEDFIDILRCLNAAGCEYLVVGAHALAVHGSPRATGDLDIFVQPSRRPARSTNSGFLPVGSMC